MIDLHVHTRLCRHATGEPAEYVAAARERGLEVLAFTDHLPLLDSDDTDYTMSRAELPLYVESVLEAAQDADGCEVLLGIEADWLDGREAETSRLLASESFDLVLGSVHFLDSWAFDDPRLIDRFAEWDTDALWHRYFEDLTRAAGSGIFDVMAHPDLVKKFGHRASGDLSSLYADVALAFADADVAVEVSTAGLRKPVGEMYPGFELLVACERAGVPATIGSDAHSPSEVGYAFDRAADLLRRAGYESIVTYRQRERREMVL